MKKEHVVRVSSEEKSILDKIRKGNKYPILDVEELYKNDDFELPFVLGYLESMKNINDLMRVQDTIDIMKMLFDKRGE